MLVRFPGWKVSGAPIAILYRSGLELKAFSVKMFLPVRRHMAVRTGNRLFERVMLRCDQCGPFKELLALVVPKPGLARLEAPDHRVAGDPRMMGGVLARGGGATTDMTARGTTPKMEPPAVTSEALDATSAAGRCHHNDSCIG